MQPDPAVVAALQPFAQRAVVVAFLKFAIAGFVAVALAGHGLWLAGVRSPFVFLSLVAATLIVSAAIALSKRPALADVARRIDRQSRLQDLIVSAVHTHGDGLASLVRRDAISSLSRQNPRGAYPVELPARWRQFAAAALIVEAVMLAIAWQAPARRSAESSLTSLALPASNSAAPGQPQKSQPQSGAAARATPDPAPVSGAPAAGARDVRTAATPNDPRSVAPGSGAGDAQRVRLAAANADSDLTAGRVPAARRAIVERYFAALQSQRKAPR